ncbi:MAG: serine hydrolase [Candidatus Omnitrophota bacterium]
MSIPAIKKYTALILVFIAGAALGLLINIDCLKNNKYGASGQVEESRLKGYEFISPLLDYEKPAEFRHKEVYELKKKIEKTISARIERGEVIYVSVYFRDLLNGPWLGINEKEKFAPASLLKVPIMIACLKHAEKNPDELSVKLRFEKSYGDKPVFQNILPEKNLEPGAYYTFEELIYRMIVYSDNEAKDMLSDYLGDAVLEGVFTDMGLSVTDVYEKTDFISVKEYASFFRILFNASYLGRDMSEKALRILSESTFRSGIVAGMPGGTVVSHKFGERKNQENQTLQLHECGIVYHRDRPYLICVMTYGRDFMAQAGLIKEISSVVYGEVDEYYSNQARKIKEGR